MATKTFEIERIGKVTVYKRRNNRRINLSLTAQGAVRVSIPTWMPYLAGVNFARSKELWILSKHSNQQLKFTHGQIIAGTHHLYFAAEPNLVKTKSNVKSNLISIHYPSNLNIGHPDVQEVALKASIKVLRSKAEVKLQARVDFLSENLAIPYKNLKIKRLSRRWGSCDREKNIVLNLYLVQLPEDLIDYVICHELSHTRVLNHGSDFWIALKQISPNSPELKLKIRNFSPSVIF